jgi:hypothetical protein
MGAQAGCVSVISRLASGVEGPTFPSPPFDSLNSTDNGEGSGSGFSF